MRRVLVVVVLVLASGLAVVLPVEGSHDGSLCRLFWDDTYENYSDQPSIHSEAGCESQATSSGAFDWSWTGPPATTTTSTTAAPTTTTTTTPCSSNCGPYSGPATGGDVPEVGLPVWITDCRSEPGWISGSTTTTPACGQNFAFRLRNEYGAYKPGTQTFRLRVGQKLDSTGANWSVFFVADGDYENWSPAGFEGMAGALCVAGAGPGYGGSVFGNTGPDVLGSDPRRPAGYSVYTSKLLSQGMTYVYRPPANASYPLTDSQCEAANPGPPAGPAPGPAPWPGGGGSTTTTVSSATTTTRPKCVGFGCATPGGGPQGGGGIGGEQDPDGSPNNDPATGDSPLDSGPDEGGDGSADDCWPDWGGFWNPFEWLPDMLHCLLIPQDGVFGPLGRLWSGLRDKVPFVVFDVVTYPGRFVGAMHDQVFEDAGYDDSGTIGVEEQSLAQREGAIGCVNMDIPYVEDPVTITCTGRPGGGWSGGGVNMDESPLLRALRMLMGFGVYFAAAFAMSQILTAAINR